MSAFVVEKRDGTLQRIHFDKITERLERLSKGLDHVEPVIVAQKVIQGIYSGIKTTELDNLAADTAAYMGTVHPEYGMLAARVCISNHQKETKDSFLELATELREYINPKNNTHSPLLSEEVFSIISRNADAIQERLDYERDYMFDYFGFKTLMRSYLLRVNGTVVERPQHMWMRVSIGIHQEDLESAFKTYDLMSRGIFTHASPTLFNAGTCRSQCSSCFLLSMTDDSIEGIFETLDRCARISKTAGGIGLNVSNIRATGSYIAGTNSTSNGLVPMLRVYNATARYVDQGGGKRKGAFAIYIEPWHADIESVIDLKKNTGAEEQRARDLFYALWVPDLFMKRVQADADWSLFCPNQCPGLADSHSEAFEELYLQYEAEGRADKVVRAQDLWFKILQSQIETGGPYMLFKDACNSKSNQQNLGTIKGSNLCTEIIQYTSPDEVAVCNLASVALPRFIRYSGEGKEGPYFAFDEFVEVVKQMTRNLNQVIDINYYPVEQARTSNMKHRPIGLGVQGLADTFILMRFPFESPEARQLNTDIFEALYYAAVSASCEAAEKDGPYASFDGSPASKGQLQFDLWGVTPSSGRFDWAALKERIAKYGLCNSLLVAPMPTASTAQILGNVEAFEPFHSNMFSRRVLAGEFAVINKHLIRDLDELGIWCEEIKNAIVAGGGSVQAISQIPLEIRQLYKTVWEIKQSHLVKMAADRGPYIDQSASLNIFMAEPTFNKVTSLHFATWKAGLKTGLYYLRSRPAANAIQFTVDTKSAAAVLDSAPTTSVNKNNSGSMMLAVDSLPSAKGESCDFEEGCTSCGS